MLALPEVLTLDQAQACLHGPNGLLQGLSQGLSAHAGPVVEVDAADLQSFDSAALAVLLECRRTATQLGKSLHITHMPPRLRDLAQLYGVSELLVDDGNTAAASP